MSKHIVVHKDRNRDLFPFGGSGDLRARRYGLNVETQELTSAELAELARDPDVLATAPVMPIRIMGTKRSDGTGSTLDSWGVRVVGADSTRYSGAGVTVAVLDTGIDGNHAAFANRSVVERDFSNSGTGDVHGHGTHVGGVVFGGSVDGQRIGVAPGTSALMAKVTGDDGFGTSDALFFALSWAMQAGAHVILSSIVLDFPGMVASITGDGGPPDTAIPLALEAYTRTLRALEEVTRINRARSADSLSAVIISGVGDESTRSSRREVSATSSLAQVEGVISVGALVRRQAGLTLSPTSNIMPNVCAPGADIPSARLGGGLATASGTDLAAAHVAGVAALWWEHIIASTSPATASMVQAKLLGKATHRELTEPALRANFGFGVVTAP